MDFERERQKRQEQLHTEDLEKRHHEIQFQKDCEFRARFKLSKNGIGIEELFERGSDAHRALHGYVHSNIMAGRPTEDLSRKVSNKGGNRIDLKLIGEAPLLGIAKIPVLGWRVMYDTGSPANDYNGSPPQYFVLSKAGRLHVDRWECSRKSWEPTPSVPMPADMHEPTVVRYIIDDLARHDIPFIEPPQMR